MAALDAQGPAPLGRRRAAADAIAPDGSEIRLLIDGRHGAGRSSMVEVTLPAGEVSLPVYHRTVEEIWYILEGEGWVWRSPRGSGAGVGAQAVSRGDALAIPVGWSFQFAAGAGGPLRFLCHTTPPWPGDGEAVPVARGGLGAGTAGLGRGGDGGDSAKARCGKRDAPQRAWHPFSAA